MKVQWHPPGDPRHSASTPVQPAGPDAQPGAVVRVGADGATYWLRLNSGVPSWKRLSPGDWIVADADGVVRWMSDRRMKEGQAE